MGDYLVRAHQLAGGLGQIGQAGLDYGRTAANTLGIGDSLLASQKAVYSDITGNAQNPNTIANVVRKEATGQSDANDYLSNLAAAKADTAAASARLGPAGTICRQYDRRRPARRRSAESSRRALSLQIARMAGEPHRWRDRRRRLNRSRRGWTQRKPVALGHRHRDPVRRRRRRSKRRRDWPPGQVSARKHKNAESAAYFPTHSINSP